MRVLLIEDDISVTQSIELMLQRLNVQISVADMGEHGIDLGRLPDYDIILLDLNLPDMSGYDVLRQLRLAKVSTPVLILSGLDGIQNKVRGLGYGADDYLTKPFHKDELIARIQAIIRRSSDQTEAVLQCGDLTVKPQAQQAEVGGRPVNLTGTEYKILAFLAQRQGSTLTKEMLLNHLYSGMDEPEIKIIDVFICKLRKKLAEASGGRNYIETVWGRGYCCASRMPSSWQAKSQGHDRIPSSAAPRSISGLQVFWLLLPLWSQSPHPNLWHDLDLVGMRTP